MRVTKPSWVKHTDDKDKRGTIYSLSVHPDGTRLATGGLDRKVKIWSTLPILDPDADADDANPKLLSTMSAHTGTVLAVRWAHHGRFLASGGDDQVVMIWGIDSNGGGRVFGSDEVNVEAWKALTRLVGHTADVIDIAWSRDDSMLATVGLDNKVWIWDGYSFERLRKLDLHADFVKGVCWDPVGNFLATQSDDKTVKVWDCGSWELVHSIEAPFENSPKSTFFRRLSWSPDGAFIAASNAMNGPVFVAAVIEREGWNADISFVGHANTIQVAAFNPRLFFREGDAPGRATASTMLALGADDFSISIWRNTLHKPLVVLNDIFERPLLDLCWSNDGYNLYGCSGDGTICAITFLPSEFPELAPADITQKILDEYDYHPPQRPNAPRPIKAPTTTNGFGPSAATTGGQVNVLQVRKGKAKRPAGAMNGDMGGHDAFSSAPLQDLAVAGGRGGTKRMFEDMNGAFGEGGEGRGSKRVSLIQVGGAGRGMEGATNRPNVEVREIRAPKSSSIGGPSTAGGGGPRLPLPRVQNLLRATGEEGCWVEVHNSEGGKNRVEWVEDGKVRWKVFVEGMGIGVVVGKGWCAVAGEGGEVGVWGRGGFSLMHVRLEAPCVEMAASEGKLALITADCHLRIFDVYKRQSLAPPTNIASLLSSPSSLSAVDIVNFSLSPSGAPIIQTSLPAAYAFSVALGSIVDLVTSYSLSTQPATSSFSRQPPPGPLGEIEAQAMQSWKGKKAQAEGEEFWDEATEMGWLESRMRAAEVIGSEEEWIWAVRELARVIVKGGWKERGRDLVDELTRPSSGPGIVDVSGRWKKSDVAEQVIQVFAQSTALAPLVVEYQAVQRYRERQ